MSKKRKSRGMSMESGDHLKRPYPTIDGVAVSPFELTFPESHMNPESRHAMNNHHAEFYNRWFGANVLFRTFRNLEVNQYGMMIDTHSILHERFGPPAFPTPFQAIELVNREYEEMGRLRYGSQNNPEFKPLLGSIMAEVERAYEALGGRQDRVIIDMSTK